MKQPRLILQNNSGSSSIPADFLLELDHMRVGREPEMELRIQSPFISRNHAEIDREGDDFTIRDSGSKNGTYVNGSRITETPVTLKANDMISFSPEIKYLYLESETVETQSVVTMIGTCGIVIDDKTEDVYVDGMMIKPKLGHNEYLFIKKLTEEPDRIHTYDELIKYIYPETNDGNPYVVPIYMKYIQTIKNDIQKKIRKSEISRDVIKSRTNEGYYLVKTE